jgi:hypothetical protein
MRLLRLLHEIRFYREELMLELRLVSRQNARVCLLY